MQDGLGQALDDGRVAHAGLADQDRIVLGSPREDADAAAEFRVTADDGVELALAGVLDEIAAVLLQCVVGFLGVGRGHALVAAHFGQDRQKLVPGQSELPQYGGCGPRARLVENGQEHVLDADVFILHLFSQIEGREHDLVHALRDVYLSGLGAGATHARHLAKLGVQNLGDGLYIVAGTFQQAGHEAVLLPHQGAEQMVHVHLLVSETDGRLLGFGHRFLRFLREFIQIHVNPP
ncbi:hypothetical protein DSECCO2_522520 [anaerobic digester metagenome]